MQQVAWARGKVGWLDPLVASDDPILGRRRHELPEDDKVPIEESPDDWMYDDDLDEEVEW